MERRRYWSSAGGAAQVDGMAGNGQRRRRDPRRRRELSPTGKGERAHETVFSGGLWTPLSFGSDGVNYWDKPKIIDIGGLLANVPGRARDLDSRCRRSNLCVDISVVFPFWRPISGGQPILA